jgi:CheY-like chemotaxis protein
MIQANPEGNSAAAKKMLFDLCVFDLDMPICNGFEACKKICSLYSKQKLLKIREELKE